jgi:hypothetical protein
MTAGKKANKGNVVCDTSTWCSSLSISSRASVASHVLKHMKTRNRNMARRKSGLSVMASPSAAAL